MNTLNAIIIDDEKNNADLLVHFLEKYCPIINIVACCLTRKSALESIEKNDPDLLFLDIILDEGTAFDLLKEVDYNNLQIIFTTAYDDYALKVFRYNAVDYLLKPLQIDELINAVQRVKERLENQEFLTGKQIQQLSKNIIGKNPLNFVAISNIDKVNFVKNEDIYYCKSSGRYTEFFLKDKRKLLASKPLGEYETILDRTHFFRIHKSYLVNLTYITNINKKSGNYCELSDGSQLPISRRRLDSLIQFLKII